MDLNEVIVLGILREDEWSINKPKFGDKGQLEVVGWSGRKSRNKLYIVKCSICSQDPDLFGEGYFRSLKGGLVTGQIPCGCSRSPQWSKEQYTILCTRKAKELGNQFLGFMGEWRGKKTTVKLLCTKHGEWFTNNIEGCISGRGCPRCKADTHTKPDEVMIKSFFDTGCFHFDTKFWRSDRLNSSGHKAYWYMSCPVCEEIGESFSGDLQKGKRPCACNMHRQQECYINWLIDDHNMTVAIKFGIANSSKQRIKRQARFSAYNIKQHSVYTFPSVEQCKQAERECRQELECGVVLKRDMEDGYTETTWVYNLDKIVEIYERNGGVKK